MIGTGINGRCLLQLDIRKPRGYFVTPLIMVEK